MAAADLDGSVFFGRDEVQASLFLVFLLVAETLKQNVGLIGFGDGHHLHVFVLEPDQLREGKFADLALELGEVVRCCDTLQFLLDLAVDPGLQTADMDEPAGPLALARRDQRIALSFFITQTDLTVILTCFNGLVMLYLILADLKDAVSFLEVIGVSECVGLSLVLRLNDHVFHSSQLYHVSRP